GELVEVADGAAAEDAPVDGFGCGIEQLQAAVVQGAGGTPVAATPETVAALPGPADAEAVDALVGLEVHDPQFVGQVLAVDESAQEQVVATLADQQPGQRRIVDVRGTDRVEDLEGASEFVRHARDAGADAQSVRPQRCLVGEAAEPHAFA